MIRYVVGAGGLGREVLDVLLACDTPPVAFVDERAGGPVRGLPVLRPWEVESGAAFVVGVADPAVRRRLTDLLVLAGGVPLTAVHPVAGVGPGTTIGPGSLLMAGCYVSSSVLLGRGCQVQYTASVGHDAVLADWVTVLPGANVSGSVRLGAGSTVGSGAVVLQGRSVGAGGFVGAGAVVTRDVADGQTVVGVPARPLRS